MKIVIILLVFISVSGYCQNFSLEDDSSFGGHSCNNQIVFVDSLGKEIDSIQYSPYFMINKDADTIKLEQLYNPNITEQIKNYPLILDNEKNPVSRSGYCVKCLKKKIKIIDSIDVNQDGVKEIILFREWHCSASPPGFHPYGVGTETESSYQYEVWDIKSKSQLFKVKNRLSTSITISTNVGYSSHYKFDVDVDKKGCFYLSKPSGEDSKFEMGKYKYDNKTQKYEKVKP